ncbi:1-aminocyclopropane-1-carboxylate deaminase [Bienertia sinuspersici]
MKGTKAKVIGQQRVKYAEDEDEDEDEDEYSRENDDYALVFCCSIAAVVVFCCSTFLTPGDRTVLVVVCALLLLLWLCSADAVIVDRIKRSEILSGDSSLIRAAVDITGKKQVQNIEHPSNDEVEYGGQPMSINASGMELEREVKNEVQPMIETDNVAHERESETMIEGLSEGPTKKKTDIPARTLEERTPIILNCYEEPIGPTRKDVKDLSRFLGTIARTTEFAPLNYVYWPSVPTHDQIWEYVLRGYKSKLKKMYLEAVEKGSNLNELYELVPEDELKDLISYWNTSPAKEQSKKNKRNRES